jgi:hypothetical protein
MDLDGMSEDAAGVWTEGRADAVQGRHRAVGASPVIGSSSRWSLRVGQNRPGRPHPCGGRRDRRGRLRNQGRRQLRDQDGELAGFLAEALATDASCCGLGDGPSCNPCSLTSWAPRGPPIGDDPSKAAAAPGPSCEAVGWRGPSTPTDGAQDGQWPSASTISFARATRLPESGSRVRNPWKPRAQGGSASLTAGRRGWRGAP